MQLPVLEHGADELDGGARRDDERACERPIVVAWVVYAPPLCGGRVGLRYGRQARDFEALCRLNGAVLNCKRTLDTACDPSTAPPVISCKDTVPDEPPTVVATRSSPGDGYAGRILVVRGVDGAEKPYETEVLVFRENRRTFKAINSVYWSSATIIEDVQDIPLRTAPSEG